MIMGREKERMVLEKCEREQVREKDEVGEKAGTNSEGAAVKREGWWGEEV